MREEWQRRVWIGAEMTAGEVVEALVEEMGVRKVVVHGAKTARVKYVLQVAAASGGESPCSGAARGGADPEDPCSDLETLTFKTRLLPHLQTLGSSSPHSVTFTISPAWFARIGTVGLAVSASPSKARIATRDDAKDGNTASWRPASIFGGIFGGASQEKPAPVEVEEALEVEQEEEGEGTIKGLASTSALENAGERKVPSAPASTTARLSTLFTDWMAPDPTTSPPSGTTKAEGAPAKVRIVSEPVAIEEPKMLGRKFMSFTSGQRAKVMGEGISETLDEEEDEEEDLDAALGALMVRFFLDTSIRS